VIGVNNQKKPEFDRTVSDAKKLNEVSILMLEKLECDNLASKCENWQSCLGQEKMALKSSCKVNYELNPVKAGQSNVCD